MIEQVAVVEGDDRLQPLALRCRINLAGTLCRAPEMMRRGAAGRSFKNDDSPPSQLAVRNDKGSETQDREVPPCVWSTTHGPTRACLPRGGRVVAGARSNHLTGPLCRMTHPQCTISRGVRVKTKGTVLL